jgi:hypothetical protein
MLRTRTTRALVAATALAAAVALAGCGGADAPSAAGSSQPSSAAASTASSPAAPEEPSMGELYTKVRATSLAAKSGHLSGTVTQDGEKTSLDIAGTADGSNQTLVVGVGKGKAQILTVGGKHFMSGDKGFWTEQTGDRKAADLLVGKYVQISAADAKDLSDLTLGAMLKEMFSESDLSTLEKLTSSVETRTEGGAKVWVASDGSGSEIWVDPKTERLVKIVIAGEGAGALDFDSWDAVKKVAAPPAKKIVTP